MLHRFCDREKEVRMEDRQRKKGWRKEEKKKKGN